MRITLFVTCLVDSITPEAGLATVQVLERLGHEVVFPTEQTCCGQMHVNSGYRNEALALARRFVDIFGGFDAIVAPSSSCVGNVREVYPVLAAESGDDELAREVEGVAARTFELSEFLVKQLTAPELGAAFPHKVAYHPSCHSLRVTKVGDAPYQLLAGVLGLELVELARATECCGFGGTFAVKNAATSSAMVEDKCAAIEASGAEVCVSLDCSCLMQIGGALSRRGGAVRTMHLAEILASTENQ